MLVHFPIALLFTAFLLDFMAIWRQDRVLERMGMVLLWLTFVSAIAAIVAGLYAASHLLVPPTVQPLLRAHRRDGIITGMAIALVTLLRFWTRGRWSARASQHARPLDRLKLWASPLAAYGVALVMIATTGDLGGSMVYGHGLGVTSKAPAVSNARPPSTSQSAVRSSTASIGRKIYASTCSRCHGPTPPFTHALVSSMGASSMQQFISTRMPPGHPVSPAQAKALVQYFDSL